MAKAKKTKKANAAPAKVAGGSGAQPPIKQPGLVVNWLKGDPVEMRANAWMEWDGTWNLDAAFLGAPFDGAGTVRSGSRHAPDAVRYALPWYTTYSTTDRVDMNTLRVADIGDVQTIVTDMDTSYRNITATTKFLGERGIPVAVIGGDNSVSYPIVRGLCQAMPKAKFALVHFDAHHDLRESHYGAMSSGVPYRMLLEKHGDQVQGRYMTQIGITDFCNNPTHHAYARKQGITVISNIDAYRKGIDYAIDVALDRAKGADAIFISIDTDGADQSGAPGTAAPNPFGIDARDVTWTVRQIAANKRCVGMDITEFSPPTDVATMTANWAAYTVMNFFYGVAGRKKK